MPKLPWDLYFMGIAEEASKRSIDPHYQVGAVVASEDNRLLSTGYNGFPSGFDESNLDWDNKEELRPFIIHAEKNAILYSRCDLSKAKLYCTLCPCKPCVLIARAAGIRKIYYRDSYKDDNSIFDFCKKLDVEIFKI